MLFKERRRRFVCDKMTVWLQDLWTWCHTQPHGSLIPSACPSESKCSYDCTVSADNLQGVNITISRFFATHRLNIKVVDPLIWHLYFILQGWINGSHTIISQPLYGPIYIYTYGQLTNIHIYTYMYSHISTYIDLSQYTSINSVTNMSLKILIPLIFDSPEYFYNTLNMASTEKKMYI